MGGQKLSHSDAGYELLAFSCIPVRFLFWDGDDEFPAQANILFDKSATDYIYRFRRIIAALRIIKSATKRKYFCLIWSILESNASMHLLHRCQTLSGGMAKMADVQSTVTELPAN